MRFAPLAVVSLFCFTGCTGNDSNKPDAANTADASAIDARRADAPAGPAGVVVLLSATLVTHGTMALAWRNPTSTCATVEINRKKDAGVYAVAETLTGAATSAQDMPGHASGNYCFTVTCKLNGTAAAPSNEKCVTQ